jgi:hypothetical protein
MVQNLANKVESVEEAVEGLKLQGPDQVTEKVQNQVLEEAS